jgi:hypothetical protein
MICRSWPASQRMTTTHRRTSKLMAAKKSQRSFMAAAWSMVLRTSAVLVINELFIKFVERVSMVLSVHLPFQFYLTWSTGSRADRLYTLFFADETATLLVFGLIPNSCERVRNDPNFL